MIFLLVFSLLSVYPFKEKFEYFENKIPIVDIIILKSNQKILDLCIKSIKKNAQYIHHIFIIGNYHKITHKKKISYIPYFHIIGGENNISSIEYSVHRIPDLSEHFIYCEDKMIFCRKTSIYDFFDIKDNHPINSINKQFNISKCKQTCWSTHVESEEKIREIKATPDMKLENVFSQNDQLLNLIFEINETRYLSQRMPIPNRVSFLNHMDEYLKFISIEDSNLYKKPFYLEKMNFFKKYWEKYIYHCQMNEYRVCVIDKPDTPDIKNVDFVYIHYFDENIKQIIKKII